MIVMIRFVTSSAPAWAKGVSFGVRGADWMNCTQNKSPDRKKVDSIRPMWSSGRAITGLKMLGSIHTTITTLKNTIPTNGETIAAQIRRSG